MSFNNQIDKKNTIFFGGRTRLNTLDGIKKSVLGSFDLTILSGESGTGKSVLVEKIVKDLHGDIFPLVLQAPEATYEELISEICKRFNINEVVAADQPMALDTKQQLLVAYLERQVAINRRVVIVIDSAQTMTMELLAPLVQLAATEDNNRQLFKIVLVGSLALNTLALSAEMNRLIGKRPDMFQLNPLGHEEIKAFMRLRMNQSKFKERELFSPPMLAKITSSTQGLLSALDSLLDSVLLFADGNNKISLANFNEAFDFFTLLVKPPATTGFAPESPAKSSFYADNQSAKTSLLDSIKEKVSSVFKPDDQYQNYDALIVNKPTETRAPEPVAENSKVTEGPVPEKPAAELDFELSEMALQAIAEITTQQDDNAADAVPGQVLENSPAEITNELLPVNDTAAIPVEVEAEAESELEAIKNSTHEGRNYLKNLITAYENEIPDIFDNPIDALIAAESIEHPENVSCVNDVVVDKPTETIMAETVAEIGNPSEPLATPEEVAVVVQPAVEPSLVDVVNPSAQIDTQEAVVGVVASPHAPTPLMDASVTRTLEAIPPVKIIETPLSNSINPISNQENIMSRSESLGKVLKAFKEVSPDVEAAALISDDGLIIASVLPHDLDETKVGGMSATILSLGTRCASVLKRGKVEEVIVRGDLGYSILLNAGKGTLLLAVTHPDAKLGLITFDMRDAIAKIAEIL